MIIGITGKKGSGKDTLGDLLMGAEKVSFADPLRSVAVVLFGLSHEEMTDRVLKEKVLNRYPYESPRSILQKLGTDAMRRVWPDVWIECWKRKVAGLEDVVVTDVRFLNEAQAIRDMGGMVVRVIRPSLPDSGDKHPSEVEMDSIAVDFTIINDGHPSDMLAQLIKYGDPTVFS